VNTQQPQIDRLIRIDEVMHICGLSRSALYASIQKKEFPSQVKLSKQSSAWLQSEVLAWIATRVSMR
jgi:prophage regulatory protein